MVFRRTLPFMLALFFSLIPHSIQAQQKIPIELKIVSDDTVGNKLANRINKDIQRSAIYEITSDIELPRLKLTIVTLDPYNTKVSTIYILLLVASKVYLTDIFISSNVGVCGLDRIKDVAQKMLVDIDKNTEYYSKAKKDWDYIDEKLRVNEQKLIKQINDMQNRTNELEEQLKTEKAKSWWKKLKETIQSRFNLSGVGLQASQPGESLKQPPAQQNAADIDKSQPTELVAKVTEPKPSGPMKVVSDAKPTKVIPPVTYVGSITSNKYHYPFCKWAAEINPQKLQTFSSVKEAQERGYIPCPTCGPPRHDP